MGSLHFAILLLCFTSQLSSIIAVKQSLKLFMDENCAGETREFLDETTDVVRDEFENATSVNVNGVWELHIWDMKDTTHKIVKFAHPEQNGVCINKRDISDNFDLSAFKFRTLERIGPADTGDPYLVVANAKGLTGVRYSFNARKSLPQPVVVLSAVLFGSKNKWKAFEDQFFACKFNCFTFTASGGTPDDFDIHEISPSITVHAVDPDVADDCGSGAKQNPSNECTGGGTNIREHPQPLGIVIVALLFTKWLIAH